MPPTHIPTPFTYVSPTDQQPGLWVVSVLACIYSFLALGLRFVLRRTVKTSDLPLGLGYVTAFVSWSLLWVALKDGVGKSRSVLSDGEFESASRLTYGSIAGIMLAIGMVTASQCLFVAEQTHIKWHLQLCYTSAAGCGVTALGGLLAVLSGCSPSRYLYTIASGQEACQHQVARWTAAGFLLSISSCIPAALPPLLFHILQVPFRRKLRIYFSFGVSVLNVPLIALMFVYFREFNQGGEDSIGAVRFLVLLNVIVTWSFASAIFPCTRPIAFKFTTSRSALIDELLVGTEKEARSYSASGKSARAMPSNPKLRDDVINQTQSRITAQKRSAEDDATLRSYGSRCQIIRKTVAIEITDDFPAPKDSVARKDSVV